MQIVHIVEDDENIRALVCYALESAGFDSAGFESADLFLRAVEKSLPDLLLLDIMLPGEDGLSLLHKLRRDLRTAAMPVVLLTARGSEYDRVRGLDLGADDYITKPFSVLELLSRVRAVLRRTERDSAGGSVEYGGIALHPERRTVTANGRRVELTYKEFELLNLLLQNRGIVLTRERIMDRVWGFDYEGESRTVDMHIKTLRQKLGDHGTAIITVRGVGYRMGE